MHISEGMYNVNYLGIKRLGQWWLPR